MAAMAGMGIALLQLGEADTKQAGCNLELGVDFTVFAITHIGCDGLRRNVAELPARIDLVAQSRWEALLQAPLRVLSGIRLAGDNEAEDSIFPAQPFRFGLKRTCTNSWSGRLFILQPHHHNETQMRW